MIKTVCEYLACGFDTLASVRLRLLSPSRYSTQVQAALQPNVFVDISATLEIKVQAMALYESGARRALHGKGGSTTGVGRRLERAADRGGIVRGRAWPDYELRVSGPQCQ